MDLGLNSPVNVQRSPTLSFSPHSSPFTLVSPTIPQPDASTLPPPANNDINLSSSEPSSPITAPEPPLMPEATSTPDATPAPLSNTATAPRTDPDLLSARNELAEAREQLAQVRAQLLEVQEQNAEIRARQTQILENLNSDSDPGSVQSGAALGIQPTSNEPETASTSPQDTPSTDASTEREQSMTTGAVEERVSGNDAGAPETESSQPANEESVGEPLPPVDLVTPTDAPGDPTPPAAPDETPLSSPPVDASSEPPEWADVEEDTSVPDEEELKEIEGSNDVSARDVKHHEDSFYAEAPEDPEQQPSQKMRLTWVIKGVRGTKEKPNRARIMNSPAVLVGGFYWYLKFFPRGNNSSALSAYVKCSRKEPKPDEEVPENTFSAVYGDPGADLGELKPAINMSIPATDVSPNERSKSKDEEPSVDDASKKTTESEAPQHDESANASADTEDGTAATESPEEGVEDWRVSAQIGIIIYNPEEPTTKFDMAACHQFNKHNDDWGWTNFHGPWSEIHKRRRGQRQALLRNDTLALDAYVRIFNDPSEALWWHHCGAEEQWDSVSLTGYPAMGTKMYHSPSVAGITSWLLLAPFRKIFQSLETDGYRKDSHLRPPSLCAQLQMILYLMRRQKRDEKFVSLEAIVEIIDKIDESGTDVITFWEGFRRSLELELQSTPGAVDQIADIFDGRPGPEARPVRASPLRIPVENASSVQRGLEQVFAPVSSKQCFPKFLTVELERQKFDTVIREWKLSYDRVRLSEELDLSQWSAEPEISKYTLYGFVVHVEERNSGKFYSILRPNGPGSKWLAFEDGTPNQVISYTKRRIQEFEGLEGEALRENKATRQTAYLAMYIRTDLLKEFLPGALEPYALSPWLKNCPQVRDYVENKDVEPYEEETRSEVKLEIYASRRVGGRHGLVDMQELKDVQTFDSKDAPQHLTVAAETTYQELRQKLAQWNGIDKVEKIKLWTMQPPSPGAPLNASFKRVSRLYKTIWDRECATRSLCVWMHVLETDDEIKSFGDPEPAIDNDIFDRTIIEDSTLDEDVQEVSESAAPIAAEPEPTADEAVEAIEVPAFNAAPLGASTPVVDAVASEAADTNEGTHAAIAAVSEAQTATISASDLTNTHELTMASDATESSASTPVADIEGAPAAVDEEAAVTEERSAEQAGEAHAQSVPAQLPINSTEALSQAIDEPQLSTAVSPEDESLIAALIAQDLEGLDTAIEADLQADNIAPTPDIEHGEVPPNASPASDVVDGASPTGLPAPEQPELESQERAPPPPAAGETPNDDAPSDSSDDDEGIPVRPVSFYYGFIQIFNAHAQDFVMHGDFLAQASDKVKEFIRKRLGYTDEKDFLVWRRGNAYRLDSVQTESSFEDIKDHSGYRHDGFVLVVGDVLSDST
jgi:Ubiquitin carboxyl-terminal hydrolase